MQFHVYPTKEMMGKAAAERAATLLREALAHQETVRFIVATGASQFEFLAHLSSFCDIDWDRAEMFHLDEYVGIDPSHPASFVRYLEERLVRRVNPGTVNFIRGNATDTEAERQRLSELIAQRTVDIAFIGVGENGHIAFNDPPADFTSDEPYLILDLDEQCRKQQVGEGWFKSVNDVPPQAYTMSVKQIMKSRHIICTVPDNRKARAVRECFYADAEITPLHPASILKNHDHCDVFLDEAAAGEIRT